MGKCVGVRRRDVGRGIGEVEGSVLGCGAPTHFPTSLSPHSPHLSLHLPQTPTHFPTPIPTSPSLSQSVKLPRDEVTLWQSYWQPYYHSVILPITIILRMLLKHCLFECDFLYIILLVFFFFFFCGFVVYFIFLWTMRF